MIYSINYWSIRKVFNDIMFDEMKIGMTMIYISSHTRYVVIHPIDNVPLFQQSVWLDLYR